MPCVTDDNSKAVQRITEIQQRLQETKAEWDRWLAAGGAPSSDGELAEKEREGKALTDRLQALATALGVQRALASPALHAQERALAKALPKKMKDFGYRPVRVQFLGGLEVELTARYWCRSQARADKGKGSYFGLTLLGVCDRTTPALASEVAQLAAALSSFEDAQARLRQMGVEMSIRRIANVAYHFAQRARSRQEVDGMGIEGSLAGKRVVISTDGGRLRVRKDKRGKKTKKGRSRYHTDWRELKQFLQEVERLCRGKRGKDWARERDYLLRNARAGRLNYSKARWAKMPMGSGSMESAVRRVINLRLKGPGIFWHEEHAEQMLLLRAYYKSKPWQVLTNKAFATPLTNAA